MGRFFWLGGLFLEPYDAPVLIGFDHSELASCLLHRDLNSRYGYIGAGMSLSIWQFILVHFAIGLGSSATFGPLMAEASHWFERHRGLAVTIAASGNYVGGTIWPPVMN